MPCAAAGPRHHVPQPLHWLSVIARLLPPVVDDDGEEETEATLSWAVPASKDGELGNSVDGEAARLCRDMLKA